MLILLLWGLQHDMGFMPPDFGSRCEQAYDEIWKRAPWPDAVPPPGAGALDEEMGSKPGSGRQALATDWFELEALSARVGFNHTLGSDPASWAQRLGAGWYLDWSVQSRSPEQKPEHWQMVRLGQGCVWPNEAAIRWIASHYPGAVWVIGNEPDNIWQDNLTPESYAQAYHDLYTLIKETDPRVDVAVGGVTQGTALRLAYLDRVLSAYAERYGAPMPVDWWTVHGFVLREERASWGAAIPPGFTLTNQGELYEIADVGSLTYFQEHIINFRTWMAANGYQDKPLAVTEFGILLTDDFGYTPEVVASYLTQTFTWLNQIRDAGIGYPQDDDRLVQRWAWFSLYDKLYYASNLAHLESGTLTDIGMAFQEFVEEWRP